MPQQQSGTGLKSRDKTRSGINEPSKYAVVFHNDDFTPMDFVVIILVNIFGLEIGDAEHLMMKVHTEGKAIVKSYSYDVALSKASQTMEIARQNGFPLRLTVEKI